MGEATTNTAEANARQSLLDVAYGRPALVEVIDGTEVPFWAAGPARWPIWATTEDGDTVWVRHDQPGEAIDAVADEMRSWDVSVGRLVEDESVPMVLDLVDVEWAGSWLLRPAGDDAQDVRVYRRFDVEADW